MLRLLLLVSLLYSQASFAAFLDGNDLYKFHLEDKKLNNNQNGSYFHSGYFTGYIVGITDLADGLLFCIPANASVRQLSAVVAKYLEANPQIWTNKADKIVVNALATSFPCQTS